MSLTRGDTGARTEGATGAEPESHDQVLDSWDTSTHVTLRVVRQPIREPVSASSLLTCSPESKGLMEQLKPDGDAVMKAQLDYNSWRRSQRQRVQGA